MATVLKFATESATQIVDDLGLVKAQIADLQEREKSLRDQLVESGLDAIEGELFRATVSRGTVRTIGWKSVVESLEQTPALKCRITRATSVDARTTVKVVSR